ncbi:lipid droplet-associated protein [uncultured Williamsia sp.]|uniref:lipid droplet-associated protein n=1 Tax=uncultured Williamsia sp. TaxID=259311 RepID=UPI00262ED032|nr:lipid droplet-associated protein [uncultured Williamsia sp.]
MVRPPFAARVMTGLLVTAIEETRKLPTTAVTLPMTAVSTTVQVAMRLQQNIAELAIKGDDALDHWFHRAQEQPSWATFDDDLDALRVDDEPDEPPTLTAVPDAEPTGTADAPVPADPPTPAAAATTPVAKAPPKKSPAKAPAKKAAVTKAPDATAPTKKSSAKKAPAKKAPAATTASASAGDTSSEDTMTAKGRFALYSSAPDTVLQSEVEAAPTPTPSDAPEIVEYLDYDSLTLAQLRAKIRSIDVDDLRTLAEYERSHRGRAPFATMLDNRITAAGAK